MEKGQVVKVALGVGVIGSALAYLAYTKYKEMDSEPQEDTTDATQGVEQEMQTIKQEVKSVIDSAKNTKIILGILAIILIIGFERQKIFWVKTCLGHVNVLGQNSFCQIFR